MIYIQLNVKIKFVFIIDCSLRNCFVTGFFIKMIKTLFYPQ